MELGLAVAGVKGSAEAVKAVGERAAHPEPALQAAVTTMRQTQARRFRLARTWEPDRPSTLQRKAREGYSERTLFRTGRLRDSLATIGDPDQIVDITLGADPSLRFGTRVYYAKFLQAGPRKPLDFSTGDKGKLRRLMKNWLAHGVATDKKITSG